MSEKAFWRIGEWCTEASISHPTFTNLPEHHKPKMATVGLSRVIIESPRQWIERLAAEQQRNE